MNIRYDSKHDYVHGKGYLPFYLDDYPTETQSYSELREICHSRLHVLKNMDDLYFIF